MTEPLIDFDSFIYDEMMVHPVLFTHAKARKIALIQGQQAGLAREILKHTHVTNLCLVAPGIHPEDLEQDPRLEWDSRDANAWLSGATPESFDVIIIADTVNLPVQTQTMYQDYLQILTKDGILVCQSNTLFQLTGLKSSYDAMRQAGFEDLQVLHFPQPKLPFGSRAAIMASKKGAFKRIREKDIFNKSFITRYYNFDIHNAALVMPEFMREELAVEN
jgi:spermidine synthase